MTVSSPSSSKVVQIQELQVFITQERDSRQVRKALAVKLVYQGYSYESVVEILDVSLGSVSHWKQAYETEGLLGFRLQYQGRKSYLSELQKQAVLQWLQQKDIWTLGELESHLAEVYDVVYESKQSYYDLFEAADISWKKTTQENPKADPKAVAAKKLKLNGFWHATAKR